jgi:hypothetical protein
MAACLQDGGDRGLQIRISRNDDNMHEEQNLDSNDRATPA